MNHVSLPKKLDAYYQEIEFLTKPHVNYGKQNEVHFNKAIPLRN
jgi:hypothetical protein